MALQIEAASWRPQRTPTIATMNWAWHPFDGFDTHALYDALALRCRVFVCEQGPYLDPDGIDQRSWHLLGRDADGALVAYLRVVEPGIKYVEPSIGRVITAPQVRGTGAGRLLMREGIARARSVWPGCAIRISAQARLQRFYEELGFSAVGDEYLEDDIPHLQMLLAAEPRAAAHAALARSSANPT